MRAEPVCQRLIVIVLTIPRDAVFFNQWSLQPLLVPRELCADPDAVFAELKGQIFEQMEQQLPQAYRAAARLTRIAPYPFLLSIIHRTKRTAEGTFMYSFLPETSLSGNSICGCRIENLYHVPAMPPMTGVGIFMNSFRGMLNLTLSRREGIPGEHDLRRFHQSLYG